MKKYRPNSQMNYREGTNKASATLLKHRRGFGGNLGIGLREVAGQDQEVEDSDNSVFVKVTVRECCIGGTKVQPESGSR